MKKLWRLVTIISICSIIVIFIRSSLTIAEATGTEIVIDGYSDDWSDKPYSWEYNWDNPWRIENYWDAEVQANITKEYRDENGNPYNLEIRHEMSLFRDAEYVYLHIIISTNYNKRFNGDDYQFWVDGKKASFRITSVGGSSLTGKTKGLSVGVHTVELRHRESSLSGTVVSNTQAILTKKAGDTNNELELKIPLASLAEQNPAIDYNNVKTIQFFTPNLMYRRVTCTGTSTAPYVGIALSATVVGTITYLKQKKKK